MKRMVVKVIIEYDDDKDDIEIFDKVKRKLLTVGFPIESGIRKLTVK